MKQTVTYRCPDCEQTKDLATDFYNNRSSRNGKDGICKDCRKKRQHKFYEQNPDYNKNYWANVAKPRMRGEA